MLSVILIVTSLFLINVISYDDDDLVLLGSRVLLSIIIVLSSINCLVGDFTVNYIMNKYEQGKIKKEYTIVEQDTTYKLNHFYEKN